MPDRRSADLGPPGHFQHRKPISGKKNDLRTLDVFERAIAVAEDRDQSRAILRTDENIDCLGHGRSVARHVPLVNRPSASVH